ncbi:hybrid sensor histidine kinase/response regulator [Schlesneria paludicola]|uniref:hybrid sensor histidine kinase/response regulator n=1 Tax=Schlesneria paludicola TaxID=360056 RepID=UPI00029A8000|nr:PAS domain S-box protein [Schlesneria paludicola]
MTIPALAIEARVLLLMPTSQDAARTCDLLRESGLDGFECTDIHSVCRELAAGAGAILLTDETIAEDGAELLTSALENQPSWSDVPLIVLSREGASRSKLSFREPVNVTLIERPVRMHTLISVIKSALRARNRQYEVRDNLIERQVAAESAAAERERLRITLASIGDAVISTDADGKVTFLNGVAQRLTGWSQTEANGRHLSEIFRIVNEHTRQLVENPALRALQKGVIVGLANHTILISRDGAERPIDDSAAPIRDGSGNQVGAVLVFRDVTERKRSEEAQARLAAIVESSDDAIISKSLDGVIRTWNAGAERLFGYSSTEAIGQPITLILPPERLVEEREILNRLRRGERVDHFETVRLAKGGRTLNVSLTISPIRDAGGRVVGASKVARDITSRTQIEADLRRSEERYRTLFDFMGQAFCVIEMLYDDCDQPVDYRFLEVNPAFEVHTGLKDAVGRTMRELVPDHDAHWFEIYDRVASTGRSVRFVSEAKALGRWYDVSAYRPGGPNSRRVAVLFTDITERKRAEDSLRDADRRKDEFIALLAHELRNPLAPIRNGLQVLQLGANNVTAIDQARSMMERQLGHMVRLIDDLLDVSRIGRNKMELRRSRVSVADILDSALETARPLIDAGGHGLMVSLSPEPIFLDADLTRLAQVFGNLLSNSAKYTPHGGDIWISAERRGNEAVISVRDDGIGIPNESLDSIFDMFSQVDRSIERSTGGLGIGLALVKGLVEMHGGSVSAESPGSGRGSTFTVRLPALEHQNGHDLRHTHCAEPPKCDVGRRFLVVDDNRDSATSMAMMLKLVGNDVRTANDGLEAVEASEQFRPQVILMDVGMPKLNGYEATRRIREERWGKSIVIIALTGWGQEGDRAQSRDAGCNGHLVKPVSFSDLEDLLSKLTDGPAGLK